jgi:hypothetical protein
VSGADVRSLSLTTAGRGGRFDRSALALRNQRLTQLKGCQPAVSNDLFISAMEIRMEPRRVRPGEQVQFIVPIHNRGDAELRDVTVEFAIPSLSVQHRETVSLRPQETLTLVFEMQFSLQDFRRPVRPRFTVDPNQQIADSRPRNNRAVMQPIELAREFQALAGPRRQTRNRARLVLEPGGCAGLRFNGQRVRCDSNPDFQIQASLDGFTIRLRGEQLALVNGWRFDQVQSIPEVLSGTEIALPTGRIAAIRSRGSNTVLVRLVNVRRTAALRGRGRLPEELSGPRLRDFDRGGERVPGLGATGGAIPLIQVVLEWIGE